ncbi:MAG: hypothetical protein IJN34_04900 [Clostridia bacterium]|nr:hypothetical protein [Clostridia bacterium]
MKKFLKRSTALLLVALMVLTNVPMLQVSAEGAGEPNAQSSNAWNGTAGELVAENYPLNDYEKAILACSGLAGATYSVEIPTEDNTGLVTVDADAQTVTAKAYTVGGFTWEPTAAVLKYTNADGTPGTDVNVTLNKVGDAYVGNFQKPANSYRAEVTYSLLIAMDEADQKLLLNTPFYLAEGYGQLKSASSVLGMATDTIDEKMEDLRALYNGITYEVSFEGETFGYTIGLEEGSAVKKALGNLLADYDSNGGRSTLALDIEAYNQAKSKVQFMMEKGAEMKAHISEFFTQIATIEANSDELLEIAEQLEILANGTGAGTIAEAKATIDQKAIELNQAMEDAIQTEIIEKAIQKAEAEYGDQVNLDSLRGKTRENDAIYKEIDAKRAYFEEKAAELEELGTFLNNASLKAMAEKIRTEGQDALNKLEAGIREAYTLGDQKIAELLSKKNDLDAYAAMAEEKAADIRKVVTSLSQAREIIKTYNNQEWKFIGKKLLKDTVTAEEYKALDKAVKAAIDPITDKLLVEEHSAMAIKAKLLAEETVLSAMVDQFVVYVDVKAEVVAKNAVNSADLLGLAVVATNFPMDKDTAAADVLAAITASGVEASALAQWDSYYNIGEEKYNRTVSIENAKGQAIDDFDALTGDIRYIITYSPKTYKINETYLPAGENSTEVPYGYNWRLPRPAELTKSYDYKIDGVDYRENTIVRIEKDITVSREEGKAIAAKTLAELIALGKVDGAALSAKEKDVLNSNAFRVDSIYYRTPDSNDKLAKVFDLSGNSFKLEAKAMNAGLLGSDAEWIPVSAYPVLKNRSNGASFSLTKNGDIYEGTFACTEEFSSVQVVYQLSIEGLDADQVRALANIADVLVQDTAEQKATLDALCTQNNFYENLGQVNSAILGSVGSVVTNMSPAAKAALTELTERCINPESGLTYLYEYLTQYKSENGGLSYFYKGENAANIQKQIDLVNKLLPVIWNDAPVQDALVSMNMQSQGTKVEAVMNQLKATSLKPINALVDTNSAYIDNMLAAVLADGTTSAHNVTNGVVTLETILSAGAPGLTSYGVEIQVLNKNDGLVKTYKTEAFGAQNNEIPAAKFEEMYAALLATIPDNQYYVAEKNLPAAAVKLGENPAIFTCAMRPVTYTVKIEGAADQILYAFDAYTITLPGTGAAGLKYRYNIGSSKVDVSSGALENFALATNIQAMDALFGADRVLTITRELIDINKDNLLTFIGKLNKAFAKGGLVADGKLAAAFIPMEDAEGNLSIVLRVTNNIKTLSPASLAGEMMDLVQDLSYVGLNGSPLFGLNSENEMKLYLQSIINMLVNSNLGLDTLPAIIDANGNIKEMQLPGATVINESLNVEGAVINNVDQLGGKLMESTLQYGVNINNATSAPFYVTYQDFDTQADLLKKAKKGAEQILPYFNLNCKDGAVNMTVNAPDSVYAYLMTALLVVGEVDMDTLQSYNLQEVLDYSFELIDPMFETEGVTADTFVNTIEQTGFYDSIAEFDTEANRALIEFIYDSLDHLYDNTSRTGSSNGGKYEGIFTYDALDVLLNNKVSLGDLSSMIAEKDSGLSVPVTFELKNREAEYEALVLDIKAKGITNKYYMTRDAAKAISTVGEDGIIILLSDIRGNITFNNNVILNLNGYSIDGDLTAKGRVAIVDSTLSTDKCGSVVGKLITEGGNFILGGGKYLSGAEKYLEDGYYLENNIVTNGCFTIAESGEDLNVYLGTDYLSLDKTAAKIMATDILFKLWMNYYACSELVVDGNTIYTINLQNVTESLNDLSKLISKGVECFDCVGATAFATQFMADVTDFGALAEALDQGDALVSYTVQNAAFNPYMQLEGKGKDSYFTFNVEAAADKKQFTNLNVFMDDDVPANHQSKLIDVLEELDAIVTFNELKVQIDDITYGDAGLSAEGEARADVEVDLSKNVNYPVIMGAILAYNAKGAERADLVEAIEYYQTSGSALDLKAALETATSAEILAALKATKSVSFSAILKALGITAPEAVELESLYTIARKVAGTVVEYSKKNGNNATLAGLKVSGEYATYKYTLQKSADTYAKMSLILFAEEKAITVKDKNGLIYLTTDDLAEALTTLRSGAAIYVNKPVVLEQNVVLPALSFKLVNANNIDFGGKTLEFADGSTKLTTDKDLSAHIFSDSSIFCSEVTSTQMDGWFIFRLEGDRHEWEKIPAVKEDCENPGSTEGEWCKICHKYQDGKKPQEIKPTGHSYTSQVIEPTCFDGGYTLHTCGNCGDTYKTDPVNATNHEGTTEVLKGYGATCTEDGLTDGLHCTKCGTVLKEQTKIPAQHTPEAYEKAPTCTEPGIANASKCKVCGVMVDEGTVVFPTGHGVVVEDPKAPNCTEEGWTSSSYCPVCGHVHKEKVIIPALGHKPVTDPAVTPNCTDTGWTEGSHCEVCGEVFVPQTQLPANGHTPVVDPAVGPSVDSTGLTEGSHCGVCGVILTPQKELAKLPMIHVPTVNVNATDGAVRGAKVDTANKLIYLDVSPNGFTVQEFANVYFKIDNASNSNITIYKYNTETARGANDLICNGDKVTVWATNKDGVETSVSYNIIIMGDANCDGKLNARDLVLMKLSFVGDLSLEYPGSLAADMNFDGKLNARDTVACDTKYVLWAENGYVSQAK